MPHVKLSTNVKLTNEQILTMKEDLGNLIKIFPGKSENWLMCEFQDTNTMFFAGSNEPLVYVQVSLFGSTDGDAADQFTREATAMITETLNVKPSRCYFSYFSTQNWGWNGSNF